MVPTFSAEELFQMMANEEDFILLDVRKQEDFERFNIEGPNRFSMLNIPYFDFMDEPLEVCAKVPEGKPVRVVCAKEGSSEFVATLLAGLDRENVSWLEGGINSWGNALIPRRINPGEADYEVWQFNRPAKASCGYGIVYGEEMFLFDPSRATDFLIEFAASRGAKITHTFETHLQADYISGSPSIAEKTAAIFLAHAGDYGGSEFNFRPIVDGEVLEFCKADGPSVLCTHSPGHTPGSTTYIIDERFMLTGDTVFIVSVGRPDLGKRVVEWAKTLYATLKERISVLPDDLIVLPGHFGNWDEEADDELRIMNTFGAVKKTNEEIYSIDDESEFIEYIQANIRTQPEVYDQIRKVNIGQLTPSLDEQNVMDIGKNECAASAHDIGQNA